MSPNTPQRPLAVHRILSAHCGLRVSPLCFGTMSIGGSADSAQAVFGNIGKDEAFKLLDTFYKACGNFVDTSNNYQDEQSEEWLGEWMETRGIRDQMVVATKYTMSHKQYEIDQKGEGIGSNYGGNHAESLHISLRDSLRKLRSDYIDILHVHWWDYTTSIEEMMRSLDDVVRSRKVLYLGISDAPAWIVAKANQYARDHALTPFVIYRGLWNVMVRDMEAILFRCALTRDSPLHPGVLLAGVNSRLEHRSSHSNLANAFELGREKRRLPSRYACLRH